MLVPRPELWPQNNVMQGNPRLNKDKDDGMDSQQQQRCAFCTLGEASKRCAGCKAVWYCGPICQSEHWPKHRLACSAAIKSSSSFTAGAASSSRQSMPPIVCLPTETKLDIYKILFEALKLDAHAFVEEVLKNGGVGASELMTRKFTVDRMAMHDAEHMPFTDGLEISASHTLLTYALEHKATQTTQVLLERCPREMVNIAMVLTCVNMDEYVVSPLFLALLHSNEAAISTLLMLGADPHVGVMPMDTRSSITKHITPLSKALCGPNAIRVQHVSTLLKYGADPNRPCADGQSPLMHAILANRTDVVNVLLDRGADARIKDAKGNTLLHCIAKLSCAREYNKRDKVVGVPFLRIANLLGDNLLSINQVNAKGRPPLYYALRSGNFEMARGFMAMGADISAIMPLNIEKLFKWGSSSRLGSTGAFDFLSRHKYYDEPRFLYGRMDRLTLLAAAALTDNCVLADIVFDMISIATREPISHAHIVDEYHPWTPLHIAIEAGNTQVARMLVLSGADCKRPDPTTGHTPYIKACRDGNSDLLKVMIRCGGITADDLASVDVTYEDCFLFHEHIFPYMSQHMTMRTSEMLSAISKTTIMFQNVSPLAHLHAKYSHLAERCLLTKATDDGTAVDKLINKIEKNREFVHCIFGVYSLSPLYLAIEFGNKKVIGALITAGADVNAICGQDGDTPLTQAVSHGIVDKAVFLLECGANISIPRQKDGQTPLQIATAKKDKPMIDALSPFVARLATPTKK